MTLCVLIFFENFFQGEPSKFVDSHKESTELGCALRKITIRQIKYLNNIVEQDHRGIKRITAPMMGFKVFHSAAATLTGIELYRMLKKGQHVEAKSSAAFEQLYALAA